MATYKKKLIFQILITIALIGLGYLLMFPEKLHLYFLCDFFFEWNGESQCYDKYGEAIGQPLFWGLRAILVTFLLMLFVPVKVSGWKKFSYWYLPIAIILIAMTDVYWQDFSPIPGRALFASWLGYLYLIISIILILRSLYKSYMKS